MQSQYPPIPDDAIYVKSDRLLQFVVIGVAGAIAAYCAFFLFNPFSLYTKSFPFQFLFVWQTVLWFALILVVYPFVRKYYSMLVRRSSFLIRSQEGWKQFPYKDLTKIVVTFAEGESLLVDVYLKDSSIPVPLVFIKERREYYYRLRRALRRRGVFVP